MCYLQWDWSGGSAEPAIHPPMSVVPGDNQVRAKPKFRVGERVRIAGYNNRTNIRLFIHSQKVVVVDPPVDEFRVWDMDDLRKISPRPRKRGKRL